MPITKVDAFTILSKFKSGKSAAEIAREHGVTRQAIDYRRKIFIKQGLLNEPQLGRPKRKDSLEADIRDVIRVTLTEVAEGPFKHISRLEDENSHLKEEVERLKIKLAEERVTRLEQCQEQLQYKRLTLEEIRRVGQTSDIGQCLKIVDSIDEDFDKLRRDDRKSIAYKIWKSAEHHEKLEMVLAMFLAARRSYELTEIQKKLESEKRILTALEQLALYTEVRNETKRNS